MMIEAYDRLNLKPLADKAREVYQLNYGSVIAQEQPDIKKPWWKIW
jgi:outer membrane protein assembly factor BamD (BamD/ComL family)